MQYYSYKKVYDNAYRGYSVECFRYSPDILCFVNEQQHGCFWVSAEAAAKSAHDYIDRSIRDKEKS